MGNKPRKPNTPENVQVRFDNLEARMMGTPDSELNELFHYGFSSAEYQGTLVHFLRKKGVHFVQQQIPDSNIEHIVVSPSQDQDKLDMAERSVRFAQKIHKKVSDTQNPQPYLTNILTVLSPLSAQDMRVYADSFSDFLSRSKNGDLWKVVLVQGLEYLAKKYHVTPLKASEAGKTNGNYKAALQAFVQQAKTFASLYGKENKLTDEQKSEIYRQLKGTIDNSGFNAEYLKFLSRKSPHEAIAALRHAFGLLIGIEYQGGPARNNEPARFTFLEGRGRQTYQIASSKNPSPDLKLWVVKNLFGQVDRNFSDAEMADTLKPHKPLHHATSKSVQPFTHYFRI